MKIKRSVICKSINEINIDKAIGLTHQPKAGDVAVFKVLEIGKHTRIQCADEKNHHLFPNDLILGAFGTRYATNQLEGYVPTTPLSEYHILGQGGVIGELKSIHKRFELKGPTTLELVGYAVDKNGQVFNTKEINKGQSKFQNQKPNNSRIILSIGGAMDSGKTTTAGYLCRGFSKAGQKTAYIKLTGTVYSKDKDFVKDCGTDYVTDFSSFGFPSTYMCDLNELLDLYQNLLNEVAQIIPRNIVIEIADGLLQRETSMLLRSQVFMNTVDDIIYSDGSSTGALTALHLLKDINIKPFALSGLFTAAPLLIDEVKALCDMPVLDLEALSNLDVQKYFPEKSEQAKNFAMVG